MINNVTMLSALVVFVFFVAGGVIIVRGRSKRAAQSPIQGSQIYIGNLPYRLSDDELREHFDGFGKIASLRIVKDRRSGRSKGYAFLTFASASDAQKSLAQHGKPLAGRRLVVHIAKPRD